MRIYILEIFSLESFLSFYNFLIISLIESTTSYVTMADESDLSSFAPESSAFTFSVVPKSDGSTPSFEPLSPFHHNVLESKERERDWSSHGHQRTMRETPAPPPAAAPALTNPSNRRIAPFGRNKCR